MGEKEHTLCSLIKLFLRELPNALFGFDSVDRWFEIAWMDEGLQFVKVLLNGSKEILTILDPGGPTDIVRQDGPGPPCC